MRAAEFVKLGIRTCGDLLFYLPRDYLHFTDEAPIAAMRVGDVATVRGTILQTRMHGGKGRGGKSRLEALLEDEAASGADGGHDRCVLTWFNPYDLVKKVLPGMAVRVTGKVTLFRNRLQMSQPKIEFLDGKDEATLAKKSARLEPLYAATQELSSTVIWRVLKGMVEQLLPHVEEWFGEAFLAERKLLGRQEALRQLHMPASLKETAAAKRSLAYHEFFLHQAAFAIKRFSARHGSPAVPLRVDEAVDKRIRALLPFKFTAAQGHVIETIRKDLAGTKPMNRLLQGDVGSGKTVVALYAMLAACATARGVGSAERKVLSAEKGDARVSVFGGHQAALMALTEILAEQHYMTLTKLLEGKKVKIVLLTGSITGAERRQILSQITEGTVGIIVGTHALLSEDVRFKSLAMIVIDEQHKFGVEQRSKIRTKPAGAEGGALSPHMLVMTATPIPRTLAMTAFGDLDLSVIDELPPGRLPIFTKMTQSSNREEVYAWLANRLAKKEQAFVVTPLIEDNEPQEEELELAPPPTDQSSQLPVPNYQLPKFLRTAVGVHRELQSDLLKNFHIGLLHGRMDRETRQRVMERFRQHLIDVLVATTVIEVGVDVPNATTMVVEHADRFGLSQLHQLRGRIGRGPKQSTCVLLGDLTGDDGIARLQAMVRHTSGFQIAEEDLRLRGMGQLIGTAQSGRTDIHFPELLLDPVLLPLSRRDAFNLIAADPRLLDASHKNLRQQIVERFADTISLAEVG